MTALPASTPYALPGPRSRALFSREQRFISPGIQQIATLAGVAMDHGQGATLTDVDGNVYVDFVAGICVASLGHAHPRYAAALAEQAAQLTVGSFTSRARTELVETMAELAPSGLTRLQLFSGGAEAVEAALRLAKSVTGHYEVVSFWGGFHGKTGGVLGNLGSTFKHGLGPLTPGTFLSPYPDQYRVPLNATPDSVLDACIAFLEQKLAIETTGKLAAILVEPIQGTGGNIIPPLGFLPRLREVADRHGAFLIVDEMICGFGRTGRMFGLERDPVRADAITIGKGFGAGFPVTGLLTSDAHCTATPYALPSGSSSSYGGNPLAAAAALAAIRINREEGLVENSRRMGERLREGLRPFQDRYDFVGHVDGEGLLVRLELVSDRATRAPLDKATCQRIFLECFRRGLITMAYGPSVRLNPPLVVTEEQIDFGVSVLREVFDAIQDQRTEAR